MPNGPHVDLETKGKTDPRKTPEDDDAQPSEHVRGENPETEVAHHEAGQQIRHPGLGKGPPAASAHVPADLGSEDGEDHQRQEGESSAEHSSA